MSIVLNISHGFNTKKLTVSKSTTISQLSQLAIEKFALSGIGQLTYNNKVLDQSLPLRLSPLTNNSKLTLEINKSTSKSSFEVNIKLLVGVNGETKTFIEKIDSNSSLLNILNHFEFKYSINITDKNNLEVLILNQVYTDLSLSLSQIIGNTNNLVMRINYKRNDEIEVKQKQAEINQIQLKNQQDRNLKLKLEREEKEKEKEHYRQQQESKLLDINQDKANSNPSQKLHTPSALHRDNRRKELDDHLIQQQELEIMNEPPELAPTPIESIKYSYEVPQVEEETPRLYKPDTSNTGSGNHMYENPDDDYNVTINQIKTYQKMIQNSMISKPNNKKIGQKAIPKRILIRIKFPNQNILQINFLNDIINIKVGQLFKRIDELILPQYLNNYNLKFGYPPFKKVEMGFDANNKKLIDIPDFQSELIVLIWETNEKSSTSGPFLKEDAINDIKSSSELPELILEQHRGELPSEVTNKINKQLSTQSKSETKKGVPKWLKFK